jgi:hypothetical protein
MENKPKKPRGRPKVPWDPFEDELFRRLQSGEALETVQAEAVWLAAWGTQQGLKVDGGNPLQAERIRERIKKRYEGSEGYKSARLYHREQLLRDKEP